jgi:signal transduction histidine kinase/ligand-binding sensor domain-containing protein
MAYSSNPKNTPVVLLLLFVYSLAGSRDAFAQPDDYQTYIYDNHSGLPQNYLYTISEDKLGYLWIGSFGGGLSRFDGKEFVTYTIADGLLSNIVLDTRIDRNGLLWLLHRRGISSFDGHLVKTYMVPSVKGSASLSLMAIMGDSVVYAGRGFFGYIYKDSVYDVGHRLPAGVDVVSNYVFRNHKLVVRLTNGKVRVIQKTGVVDYDLPYECPRSCNIAFAAYGDHTLLMSSLYNETYALNLLTGKAEPFGKHQFVSFHDGLAEVGWLNQNNSLLRVELTNNRADTVLTDISLNDFLVDRHGVTWICTSRGLVKHYKKSFQHISTCVNDVVMGLAITPDGAVWAGTQFNGLTRSEGTECRTYIDPDQPARNKINQLLCDSNGTLWVGSLGGLGRYDAANDKFLWYTVEDGLKNSNINTMTERQDGSLLIATGIGGLRVMKDGAIRKFFNDSTVDMPSAAAIHESKYYNRIYAGVSGEIYEIHPDSMNVIRLPELKESWLTSIHTFRDSLLVLGSLGAGLVIYQPRTGMQKVISRNSGLHNDIIYFARPHPDGSIWVGLQDGFTNLRLDEDLNISRLQHYSASSGLGQEEANQFASYFNDSLTVFGTTDGVYSFVSGEEEVENYPLHLTRVQLFFTDSVLTDYSTPSQDFFDIPQELSLPHDQNHLTFHYNMANRTGSESTLFTYMLEGFDRTWSLRSPRKMATYSNLPAGTYTFKVLATDATGAWMNTPLLYSFSIRPAFYQTPLFILICIVAAGGLIFWIAHTRAVAKYDMLMKIKEARIIEKEKLRRQLVKDFHDELGNYLARIINYINLLKINNAKPFTRDELYTKIEEMSRKLYTGTKELIWSIDHQLDSADSLFIYTRDFGQSLFSDKAEFKAYNTADPKRKVNDSAGRDVVLICKEALTNAFKHSHASEVTVSFSDDDRFLRIELSDNGKGLPQAFQTSGLGLKNFKERADKIGGTLEVVSEQDQGTSIILVVPYSKNDHDEEAGEDILEKTNHYK